MMLDETKYKNTTRVISGINNVVYNNDTVLLCDTASGVVQLDLLQIPTDKWSTVYKLYVIDNTNNASVNNITITAPVGYKINGQQTLVIDVNAGSVIIEVSSNGSYIGKLSYIVSSGNFIETKDEGLTLTTETKSYNFTGQGVTATAVGDDVTIQVNGNPLAVENEGVPLTPSATKLNFVGDLVEATATGNDVNVAISTYDSGWKDMTPFDALKGYGFSENGLYPKIRIIGRQVFMDGLISLPLADGGGNLYPNFSAYPNLNTNQLYINATDGYKVNTTGLFRTEAPIVPSVLCPQVSQNMQTSVVFVKRTIVLGDNVTKYAMIMPLYTVRLGTTGLLNFGGLKYIESDLSVADFPLSNLHEFVSKFSNGDKPIDYSASYKNSYTGGVIQQIPTELATVGANFTFSFDPRDANQYGGFLVHFGTSWLLDPTTSIADIKNAFDNL